MYIQCGPNQPMIRSQSYFYIGQSVKSHYSGEDTEDGPILKMTFAGDEIVLDIPDAGITLPSGWSLKSLEYPRVSNFTITISSTLPTPSAPLFLPLQLQRKSVDSYQPNQPIPCCKLQLQWTKTEVPHQNLSYHLKLTGASPPETYIEIIKNPPHPGIVTTVV